MRFATLLVAAAALAACASTETTAANGEPAEGRDCFRAASATGFGLVDDHNVRVNVGPSRSYVLTTRNNVNDLDWSRAIALDGPSFICTGNGLGVTIVGGEPTQHFIVTQIRREPNDAPTGS
jgi:hypothetical protein